MTIVFETYILRIARTTIVYETYILRKARTIIVYETYILRRARTTIVCETYIIRRVRTIIVYKSEVECTSVEERRGIIVTNRAYCTSYSSWNWMKGV